MKIDLSEVNKKPAKSSKEMENRLTKALHAKFKKHLNKQKGPARDTEGKFTSGSGGLKIAKKLNNKRALSVIVVVSLIGGLFVFQSFAASSANKAKVVSWYRTCLNREPESQSAVDTWAGQLDKYPKSEWTIAADFMKRAGVTSCNYPDTSKAPVATSTTAQKPAATSGSSSNQVPAATSSSSNSTSPNTQGASMTSAQVVALYKEILGRDPSQSEINSWVERSKTWTPAQIKAHLQQSSEGFKTNIAAKLQEAQAWKTLADAHVTNAKTYNDQTYKFSTQTVVSKENLDTISQRVGSVRSAIAQVNSGLSTVNNSSQNAAAIGAAETPQFQSIAKSLVASLQQLNSYLKNIEADYARANKTYEANLGFFNQLADTQRQQANCRAQGGTPTWSGGCDIPPAVPVISQGSGGSASNSGSISNTPCAYAPRSNIVACQKYLGGIAADGVWGPKTEAAFRAKFGYGSGWSQSGGGVSNNGASQSQRCPDGYILRGGECRVSPTPAQATAAERCRLSGGVWSNGECRQHGSVCDESAVMYNGKCTTPLKFPLTKKCPINGMCWSSYNRTSLGGHSYVTSYRQCVSGFWGVHQCSWHYGLWTTP